jgi:hypothetical protein
MKRGFTNLFLRWVIILGVTILLLWAALLAVNKMHMDQLIRQRKADDAFVTKVKPVLAKDERERFYGVDLISLWGGHIIKVRVKGWVETQDDLKDLHNLIETNSPLVPIDWQVKVSAKTPVPPSGLNAK